MNDKIISITNATYDYKGLLLDNFPKKAHFWYIILQNNLVSF